MLGFATRATRRDQLPDTVGRSCKFWILEASTGDWGSHVGYHKPVPPFTSFTQHEGVNLPPSRLSSGAQSQS